MNINNIKSIFELAKNASSVQLIILSFLVLPFVIEQWLAIFEMFPTLSGYKGSVLIIVLLIFTILIIVAINKDKKLGTLLLAKNQIVNYLRANDFKVMSFDRVRDKFDACYTDAFLNEVINTFQTELRIAIMYKKDEDKQYILDADKNKIQIGAVGRV